MLATSEPAPGSETPMQPTASPAIAGARNSLAQLLGAEAGQRRRAMSVCTPIAIGTPPQSTWPSASAITTEYE